MRFVIALLSLALLGAAPSPHAIDIPKWFSESFLDFREDIRDAAREKKRLLVYFGQDGCPYCKALMKVNFAQPDIVATTRKHFVPVALNIWGDREVTWIDGRKMSEKALAVQLGVQFTPTLLFFDEAGKVALRLNGYQPPEKFRVSLDYASRRLEAKQTFTEFLAEGAKGDPGPALDLPRVLAKGKPVLVVVARKGCKECDELEREAFARPEVKRLLAGFSVERQNLGGDWARANRIIYTPSLVFLDKAGKEVFRAEGYVRPFHVASALDYVAGGAYLREPSFQRYIQDRADKLRAAGGMVDIWQ